MVKQTTFLLSLLLTASVLFAQNTPTTSSKAVASAQPLKVDLLPPMQQMIATMKKQKATGDPDVDFINQAKLHTQGTQALLQAIIDLQADSALTQAAKTMLSTAQTNLATLNNFLKERKPAKPNVAFAKQQKQVIAAMDEKIKQSASAYKLTKNPETNIHLLLSDQQQDAINLASNYLLFGKEVDVRNFAQQSVEKAKLDLDVIKNLQNRSK